MTESQWPAPTEATGQAVDVHVWSVRRGAQQACVRVAHRSSCSSPHRPPVPGAAEMALDPMTVDIRDITPWWAVLECPACRPLSAPASTEECPR